MTPKPRKSKKLSIIDVAELAGVSRSTVSRVINNDPKASSPAVQAVKEAMEKLGYTPPPMETRFRRPSRKPEGIHHGYIALFFPDENIQAEYTPLSAALIHHSAMALMKNDLHMLVVNLPSRSKAPEVIVDREVDGVIIRGGDISEAVMRKLKKLPCVWLFESDRRLLWGDQVFPDNRAAGEMAADWLKGQGCKRPVIYTSLKHTAFRRRTEACRQCLEEDGFSVNVVDISSDGAGLVKALGGRQKADGLFVCGHDSDVIGMYIQMTRAGIRAVDDLPVITCVNSQDTLRALDPRIVNIDIRPGHLAETAVETLVWRMKHPREPVRNIMITPRLVE